MGEDEESIDWRARMPPLVPDDPAERLRRIWALILVFAILLVVQFAGLVTLLIAEQGLSHQVSDLSTQTAGNRQIGYQNGARQCRILVALGQELDSTCLDPNVTAYYDPNAASTAATSAAQAQDRVLLCRVLDSQGERPPACEDLTTPR